MKKIIIATSLFLSVGFIAASAFACGWGGHGYHQSYNNSGNSQEFYDETETLRSSIAADRAELKALMAGDNPDPKQARALTEKISRAEIELRKKAKKFNVAGMSMGHYGQSWSCGISGHAHNYGGCW